MIMMTAKPNKTETLLGYGYLGIDAVVLPILLSVGNLFLPRPMGSAELNFVYFSVNFVAVLLIFHKFWRQSWKDAGKAPGRMLWYVLLSYLGYQVLNQLTGILILLLEPSFSNLNDGNIYSMLREDFVLIAVGTIVLAPVAEETLFRGLIFRGLYDRHPVLAYLVSMFAFSVVHVWGYVGQGEPLVLALSILQYLPAGYCLCFAYRHGGSILSPLLLHMVINAAAILPMR